ncbi:MAG: selenide, water dikinase SelD, partial [Bacteroidetes bacterium]|nr:selenide, water dikinase SelD [Bacteroidota bacterium]
MEPIRLTQFSHGAGCGCKLSPAVLHEILSGVDRSETFPTLLIGNDTKDDAAVMDLGDGTGIISTTDFFMPIVDDPRT